MAAGLPAALRLPPVRECRHMRELRTLCPALASQPAIIASNNAWHCAPTRGASLLAPRPATAPAALGPKD